MGKLGNWLREFGRKLFSLVIGGRTMIETTFKWVGYALVWAPSLGLKVDSIVDIEITDFGFFKIGLLPFTASVITAAWVIFAIGWAWAQTPYALLKIEDIGWAHTQNGICCLAKILNDGFGMVSVMPKVRRVVNQKREDLLKYPVELSWTYPHHLDAPPKISKGNPGIATVLHLQPVENQLPELRIGGPHASHPIHSMDDQREKVWLELFAVGETGSTASQWFSANPNLSQKTYDIAVECPPWLAPAWFNDKPEWWKKLIATLTKIYRTILDKPTCPARMRTEKKDKLAGR